MVRDVAQQVGVFAAEADCGLLVRLEAEEGRKSLKVVEDNVVHSFVVRSLVRAVEEVDTLELGQLRAASG